jgi:hypothetical protein
MWGAFRRGEPERMLAACRLPEPETSACILHVLTSCPPTRGEMPKHTAASVHAQRCSGAEQVAYARTCGAYRVRQDAWRKAHQVACDWPATLGPHHIGRAALRVLDRIVITQTSQSRPKRPSFPSSLRTSLVFALAAQMPPIACAAASDLRVN